MTKDLDVVQRSELMEKVYASYLELRNPTTVAKELKMRRADVIELLDEIKAVARNSQELKDLARDALHEADKTMLLVLQKSFDLAADAEQADDLKVRATVLKNIADIEGRRVDMLQKAGLYDDAALGDELAEMQEKQDILVGILREVTSDCEKCRVEVARRLGKVTGRPEPIPNVIDGEVAVIPMG